VPSVADSFDGEAEDGDVVEEEEGGIKSSRQMAQVGCCSAVG
jgi:hypothetical protein